MLNETLEKGAIPAFDMTEMLSRYAESSKRAAEDATKAVLSDWETKAPAWYKVDDGPKLPADISEKPKENPAHMSDLGISKLANFELMSVPIGQPVIGMLGGFAIGAIADVFTATQSTQIKGFVKLGAAAGVMFAQKWIGGKSIAYPIAFVLAILGISQLVPVDKYGVRLGNMIASIKPGTVIVDDPQANNQNNRMNLWLSRQRSSMEGIGGK